MSRENTLRANERLREERLRRGWSQQKVADQLGIAVVTVNRWERGKQQPTGYYRLRLSALFEKSEEELGLVEGKANPGSSTYAEEKQEYVGETNSVSRSQQEDLAGDSSPIYEPVLNKSSLEREMSRLSLSSSYARPGIPLFHRRKRTMLLLLTLVLLVIAAPITFFLVHLTQARPPLRTSIATHNVPSSSPSQAPGKLVLYDPLTKPGGDSQWETGGGICQYEHNALQILTTGPNYCSADVQSFDNMVFQIEMSVQQGIWAGITFRANANSNLYYFAIGVNGRYEVDRLKHNSSFSVLLSGKDPAIRAGYNQVNILRVMANKTQLSFWVNGSLIRQIHDTFFADGYVGICAGSYDETTASTVKATFRNAYVWTL